MSWHGHMSLSQLAWRQGHITGDQVAGLSVCQSHRQERQQPRVAQPRHQQEDRLAPGQGPEVPLAGHRRHALDRPLGVT